jgi:16S rRNA C967 or C1407 C5-methylase (RsmB/RsmF family)/NOL1/NOP2/fmu family ribosome biogenesis protein
VAAIESLPEQFVQRMSALLGDETEAFLTALTADRVRGVRANQAKIDPSLLGPLLGVDLRPVPWSPAGFVVPEEMTLGGHPAHAAGLFYLQEPTAMAVAEALAPSAGDRVIDLAAAPGGKTTHLASLVGPDGLVAAVEVDSGRLGSLHESLDMWGAANVVTMRSSMEDVAGTGVEPFGAAILDAPCSGEGLFRRDPSSVRGWSPAMVRGCARRQQRMLARIAELLRADGVLVYSTCTFEVAENEDQLAELLTTQPGWELEELFLPGATAGLPTGAVPTQRAARLWPHRVEGDGQFVARLRRTSAVPGSAGRNRRRQRTGPIKGREAEVRDAWLDFHRRYLPGLPVSQDRLLIRADRAFLLPGRSSGIDQSQLARPGLPLGRLRPGRFEPAPALATALTPDQAAESLMWQFDDPRLIAYLQGEPVDDPGPNGWVLICCDRWPVAWSRRRGGVLKNVVPGHVRSRVKRAFSIHRQR